MIPGDLAARLKLLTQSFVQPLTAVHEVPADLPPFSEGQRFTARIESPLPDGSYRAVVAGRTMTLSLPQAASAGDTLDLVVIGRNARSIVAARAEPGLPAAPAEATLSQAGRLIGAALATSGEAAPAAAQAKAPLLPQPGIDPGTLAPTLAKALAESGVFYEAHQARWVSGRLPIAALLREPQNMQNASAPAPPAAGAPSAPPQAVIHGHTAAPAPAPAPSATSAAAMTPAQATPDEGGARAHAGADSRYLAMATQSDAQAGARLPEDLVPLVRQQLDALAHQPVLWRGELWPGQALEWEIEEQAHRAPGEDGQATAWTTSLRVTLPNIGRVAARIALAGDHASIRLEAAEAAGASALAAAGGELTGALSAAGMTLDALQVQHDAG